MTPFKHILVPTDFGEPSQRALDIPLELAGTLGADLTIMHTCEIPAYAYPGLAMGPIDLPSPLEDVARKKLDELASSLGQRCRSCKGVLKVGIPWQSAAQIEDLLGPETICRIARKPGNASAHFG